MVTDADVQTVLRHVDREAIVELAKELIKIPSFKGEESDVARFLVRYLGDRGYEAQLQEVEPGRFQTIAILRGSGSGKSLMFNGHIDIDPLGRDWQRDPWAPTVEGDRLYGVGANNMKGGVAAMIGAAEAVRRSGLRPKGDIVIAGVVGELQGGVGSKYLAEHGPRADMAVVPEPYGADNILTVHTGWLQFALHALGVSRHISQMEKATDAIEKMMKAVAALKAMKFTYTPRPDLPGLPRMLLGAIVGGQGRNYDLHGPNYVCDFCTLFGDVRFVHGQTPQSVEADLRRALDAVAAADPDFHYELELPAPAKYGVGYVIMDPFDLPRDQYILGAVVGAYRRVAGKDPATAGGALVPSSYAGNDTCHLWKAGIPCLLYGPGGGYADRAPDLYCRVSDMERVAQVLAATALDVCNLPK